MKRLIIAFILIIISVITSAYECYYVTEIFKSCDKSLELSGDYFSEKEFTKAYNLCKNAEQHWNKNAKALSVFLVHTQVSDISLSLNDLKNSVKNKDENEYIKILTKTKRQLLSVKESELPYLENIL